MELAERRSYASFMYKELLLHRGLSCQATIQRCWGLSDWQLFNESAAAAVLENAGTRRVGWQFSCYTRTILPFSFSLPLFFLYPSLSVSLFLSIPLLSISLSLALSLYPPSLPLSVPPSLSFSLSPPSLSLYVCLSLACQKCSVIGAWGYLPDLLQGFTWTHRHTCAYT